MRRYHFRVAGRVQGVGFRYWMKGYADRAGLSGSVRNMANGDVAVLIDLEPDAVPIIQEALRGGPISARVSSVELIEVSDEVRVGNTFVITG